MENKKVVYFNPETFERKEKKPEEIWDKKVTELLKLVQREDLDGYEYRESNIEKRFRIKLQDEFDKRLQAKIALRKNAPSALEQVEAALSPSCIEY